MVNEQVKNYILVNRGTGIAGNYLAALKKKVAGYFDGEGSKAAMFSSFVSAYEPSHDFNHSLLSVSSAFYIDKLHKIKEVDYANSNLLLKMFENWYKDCRRKNQKDYVRSVAYSVEDMDMIDYKEKSVTKKETAMYENYISEYFKNFATEEETYIYFVILGIHEPVRDANRRYSDFPGGSIGHVTFSKKKNILTEKLKELIKIADSQEL